MGTLFLAFCFISIDKAMLVAEHATTIIISTPIFQSYKKYKLWVRRAVVMLVAFWYWLLFHCIALRCVALHCITLRCVAFHRIALYCISFSSSPAGCPFGSNAHEFEQLPNPAKCRSTHVERIASHRSGLFSI